MSLLNANANERRLSVNGRNAYVTVNVDDNLINKTNKRTDDSLYLTAKPVNRARSCSPALLTINNCSTKESNSAVDRKLPENNNILSAPEVMLGKSTSEKKSFTVSTETINPSTGAIPKIGHPLNSDQKSQIQVGMDRYITVLKRGRSPKSSKIAPLAKLSKESNFDRPNNENRFSILQCEGNEPANIIRPAKPPPIYLREINSNTLVRNLISLIGENSFYVTPIRRGTIHETKIQVNSENDYRKVVTDFETHKKSFYTYQLKGSKGLQIVIKGVDSSVEPAEIKKSLEDKGFKIKNVINIRNREKIPQPLFRVELEPGDMKLKKMKLTLFIT